MEKLLLGIIAGLLMLAPAALAGHGGEPITVHTTYETALHNQGPGWLNFPCLPGNAPGVPCDPTGQTQDGSIDVGGAAYFPDGDTLEPGVDTVQAFIVDDVNGANVQAGWLCTDENGNNICAEEEADEVDEPFCGQSDVVSIPPAPNFDIVFIGVGGGYRQVTHGCDPLAAPLATSGGVLNPSGGIYLTFG